MAYGPYSGPSIQDIIGATMRRYPVPPQPSSMMGRGDTMALSGLGPALSGAYANVQRALLERKLQQEDLDRRRQEALADRQAQWAEEMRRMMMQRQWATEDRAALAQDPSQIRRREHEEWQMGQERRAPEIAAAAARMTHWRTYQPQQILSNPQLLSQYLRDFELSGGQPHPMRTRQVTETVPTPLPLVARTGAGAGIQPTTMQIPTGQVTEPIFPQVAEQTRLGDIVPGLRQKNPALAAMTVEDYKAKGGDIDTLIRLAEPTKPGLPQRFVITDSRGNVVKTIETPPGTQIRVLPAPPRGGAGAGTEGLTPARKRIVDQFNRIDGLVQKAQDKIDDPMMPPNSDQAKSLKARIGGYEKQKAAILRQYPWIGQYVGVGGEPAPGGGGASTVAEVQQAAREGLSWSTVEAALRKDGVDPAPLKAVYDAAKPTATQPKTISRAQIAAEAQRRGLRPWHVESEYKQKGYVVR